MMKKDLCKCPRRFIWNRDFQYKRDGPARGSHCYEHIYVKANSIEKVKKKLELFKNLDLFRSTRFLLPSSAQCNDSTKFGKPAFKQLAIVGKIQK